MRWLVRIVRVPVLVILSKHHRTIRVVAAALGLLSGMLVEITGDRRIVRSQCRPVHERSMYFKLIIVATIMTLGTI